VEGPTWTSWGTLVFSDTNADTIYQLKDEKIEAFRKPAMKPNGNTMDPQGRLVTCHHEGRCVTRTEADGSVRVLVDHYGGKRLNSPNDITVKSNGDIYFSDPAYGITPELEEYGFRGVFRLRTTGELDVLARDFTKPNGLVFSPDETRLYVVDSEPRQIGNAEVKQVFVFNVNDDGSVVNRRVFAQRDTSQPGSPDGLRVDVRGNLYCAWWGGVQIYASSGNHLGMIPFPEVPSNVAWGDEDGKTLYVTARTGLYRIRTKIGGNYKPG
jgi:gluconolactonase